MRLLLAVPDGSRKGKLLPDSVLLHRAQRSPPQPLRLAVVRVQPQVLQLRVGLAREPVTLQDLIESLEIPAVESHERARTHHRLVTVEKFPGRAGHGGGQRPEEPAQALDISSLLQILADPSHLLSREHRQRKHD